MGLVKTFSKLHLKLAGLHVVADKIMVPSAASAKQTEFEASSLRLCNTIDDYSEKYGMMGGLAQKPVTAVPVVPSS